MPDYHGNFSITPRKNGSRWYCRLSIPEEAAKAVGLGVESKVSLVREGEYVVLRGGGRVKLGKLSSRHGCHMFETAAAPLGLEGCRIEHVGVRMSVEDDAIVVRLPAADKDYVAPKLRKRREDVRVRDNLPLPEPCSRLHMAGAYDTAKVLAMDSARLGVPTTTMTLVDVMAMLRDAGHEVSSIGPRSFRLNGRHASAPDLLELATRIARIRGQQIALVVD